MTVDEAARARYAYNIAWRTMGERIGRGLWIKCFAGGYREINRSLSVWLVLNPKVINSCTAKFSLESLSLQTTDAISVSSFLISRGGRVLSNNDGLSTAPDVALSLKTAMLAQCSLTRR